MDDLYDCPYCGEPGELDLQSDVDFDSPGDQVFVQDCAVCCRPWTVTVHVSADGTASVNVDQ
ncbi:MAG: CPXCG motif-containing cysteine-rich protein [Polyangia bacterium]